ncbi:MAG: hypothetical protein GKS04_01345 [Candidatus Mycalebacterium zealandia]|nr:MAG: hypothetical protein GKS04_01345 [Candidatus Mycalebacterium zealandia]
MEWAVKIEDVDTETFDLSVRNPFASEAAPLLSPKAIYKEMKKIDSETAKLMEDVKKIVS